MSLLTFFIVFYGQQAYERYYQYYSHLTGMGGALMVRRARPSRPRMVGPPFPVPREAWTKVESAVGSTEEQARCMRLGAHYEPTVGECVARRFGNHSN